jgi:broad specificity phosphatase PhoE
VKAHQTAEILAQASGLPLHIHPDMGEVDRSATGYVPPQKHEALADALFANPLVGPQGWESAQSATARIVRCFSEVIAEVGDDLMFVGHGAVGTFLWCHLTGQPISRAQDQPRQGSFWQLCLTDNGVTEAQSWKPLEQALLGP